MGKGDKKSRKGKLSSGTYGVRRKKKSAKSKILATPVARTQNVTKTKLA